MLFYEEKDRKQKFLCDHVYKTTSVLSNWKEKSVVSNSFLDDTINPWLFPFIMEVYSGMMLLKCYTQYANKFGKLSSGHRTGKGQFSF